MEKKLFQRLVKIGLIAAIATVITGCTTVSSEKNHDWQGKEWSAVIVRPLVDTSKEKGNKTFNDRTNFRIERDQGLRMALVHVSSGFTSIMMNVIVPDQLEFSEIPKSSLVRIMVEKNLDLDHNIARFSRILEVICAAKDSECIKREDKAKRIRVVLDEHPDASKLNEQYGLTFNRRLTLDELKKYK